MSKSNDEPEMPQPCDEWHELIVAAHTAGRRAAHRLALRSSARLLRRSGSVDIHVEPLTSPVAAWLDNTGQAVATEAGTGVLMPITITAADLQPAEDAQNKALSLLVAHTYAMAYCTLLADEAGVATEIRIMAYASLAPDRARHALDLESRAGQSPATAFSVPRFDSTVHNASVL